MTQPRKDDSGPAKGSDENWKVGDLALCVKGGRIAGPPAPLYPVAGRVGNVLDVTPNVKTATGYKTFLTVTGQPRNIGGTHPCRGWSAARFIKINPEEIDNFDEEYIEFNLPEGVKL